MCKMEFGRGAKADVLSCRFHVQCIGSNSYLHTDNSMSAVLTGELLYFSLGCRSVLCVFLLWPVCLHHSIFGFLHVSLGCFRFGC